MPCAGRTRELRQFKFYGSGSEAKKEPQVHEGVEGAMDHFEPEYHIHIPRRFDERVVIVPRRICDGLRVLRGSGAKEYPRAMGGNGGNEFR